MALRTACRRPAKTQQPEKDHCITLRRITVGRRTFLEPWLLVLSLCSRVPRVWEDLEFTTHKKLLTSLYRSRATSCRNSWCIGFVPRSAPTARGAPTALMHVLIELRLCLRFRWAHKDLTPPCQSTR